MKTVLNILFLTLFMNIAPQYYCNDANDVSTIKIYGHGLNQTVALVGGWQGLEIYDASNPLKPVIVSTLSREKQAGFVKIIKTVEWLGRFYALVFSQYYELGHTNPILKTIDITDPSNPAIISKGFEFDRFYPDEVRIVKKKGYLIDNLLIYLTFKDQGLTILDISEPSNPLVWYDQMENAYDKEQNDYNEYYNKPLSLSVIEIGEQDYAVQASRTSRTNEGTFIQILDLSNPRKPQLVGNQIGLGNIYQSSVRVNTIKIKGYSYAMVALQGGNLRILDISKPNNIQIVSELKNIIAMNIPYLIMTEIKGQPYALMASRSKGISIIDIRNPLKPLPISSIRFTGAARSPSVSTLEKDGKYYLYVPCGGKGLKIIEVSDPKNPILVRTI